MTEAHIAGIDLALTTGFGVLGLDGVCLAQGHWSNKAPLEGRKAEDRSVRDQVRFHNFQRELGQMLDIYPTLRTLAYEMVNTAASKGKAQIQLYGGWRALALAEAERRGLRVVPVANSTLRSVASPGGEPPEVKAALKTQKGARRAAWKAAVVRLAQEKWGLSSLTDDAADALWVAEACRIGRGGA